MPVHQSVSQSCMLAHQSDSQSVSQTDGDSPITGLSTGDVRHFLHEVLHDGEQTLLSGRGEGCGLRLPLSELRLRQGQGQSHQHPQQQPRHDGPSSEIQIHSACATMNSVRQLVPAISACAMTNSVRQLVPAVSACATTICVRQLVPAVSACAMTNCVRQLVPAVCKCQDLL